MTYFKYCYNKFIRMDQAIILFFNFLKIEKIIYYIIYLYKDNNKKRHIMVFISFLCICILILVYNMIYINNKLYWYEIHILVDLQYEEKLNVWVEKNKYYFSNIHNPKLINFRKMTTVYSSGSHLRQPMLTFRVQKNKFDDAVKLCNNITLLLENNLGKNIVIRQKVEGLTNTNAIPYDPSMPITISGTQYYEFHTKINLTTKSEWIRLAILLSEYSIALLYNEQSKMICPVTTERYYDTDWKTTLKKHIKIKEILIKNNFEIINDTGEYSLYDTNLYTDKGWLFIDNPKKLLSTFEFSKESYDPPFGFCKKKMKIFIYKIIMLYINII